MKTFENGVFRTKKIISIAAAAVMLANMSGLYVGAQAETENVTLTAISDIKAKGTLKVVAATYEGDYLVLHMSDGTKLKPGDKNYATYFKSFLGRDYVAPNTTNSNTSSTTTSTTNTGTTSSTTSTQASGTTKNMLPVLKDVNGKAVSSTVQQVSYSYLNASQKYIYNQMLDAVKQGKNTATFDKSYTANDIASAFWAVRSDYPYRGLNVWSTSAGKSTYWTYHSDYSDPEYALAMLDAYTKPMLDKAAKMSSDVEKVKYVHDWLIYTTNKTERNWSAYNVIVGKKGMCEGYAHAFVYCMQKLGIQSMVVGGTTWCGEDHSWNLVKVGGDWYEVDVFWDDIITKAETDYTYTCFMQTTASLKAYDVYNGKSRTRFAYCSYAPIANGTKYSPSNYKYSNGSDFSGLAKVVEPNKKDFEAAQQTQTTATSKPVVTVTADGNTAKISWTAVSGATKYRVYKYENGKLVKLGATTSLSYKAKGLSKGTYKYAVKAYVDGKWTSVKNSDIVSVIIK